MGDRYDENAAWRALCDFAANPINPNIDPREPWEIQTFPRPKPPPTRRRQMTVKRALKQATKAGVAVHGVVVKADGVELQLSEAVETAVNPWDSVQ